LFNSDIGSLIQEGDDGPTTAMRSSAARLWGLLGGINNFGWSLLQDAPSGEADNASGRGKLPARCQCDERADFWQRRISEAKKTNLIVKSSTIV
jgi:hypothetical protein